MELVAYEPCEASMFRVDNFVRGLLCPCHLMSVTERCLPSCWTVSKL